jgi:hypothetical protein
VRPVKAGAVRDSEECRVTTGVLDRVPVEEITARARAARPGHVLLTLIAAVLFAAGFVVAKVFAVVFLAGAWSLTAVQVGWESAHGPTRGQQIAALEAEIERLTAENSRFSG